MVTHIYKYLHVSDYEADMGIYVECVPSTDVIESSIPEHTQTCACKSLQMQCILMIADLLTLCMPMSSTTLLGDCPPSHPCTFRAIFVDFSTETTLTCQIRAESLEKV